jgi:hypothetical protein
MTECIAGGTLATGGHCETHNRALVTCANEARLALRDFARWGERNMDVPVAPRFFAEGVLGHVEAARKVIGEEVL